MTFVAARYLKGQTMRDIAVELAASTGRKHNHTTIWRDVQALIDEWQAARLHNMNQALELELEKINRAEFQAWTGWEISLRERTKKVAEKQAGGRGPSEKTSMTKEESTGDPRYLTIILNCIERRCKLLGLDAPEKRVLTGADGGPIEVESGTLEERLEKYASVFAKRAGA